MDKKDLNVWLELRSVAQATVQAKVNLLLEMYSAENLSDEQRSSLRFRIKTALWELEILS